MARKISRKLDARYKVFGIPLMYFVPVAIFYILSWFAIWAIVLTINSSMELDHYKAQGYSEKTIELKMRNRIMEIPDEEFDIIYDKPPKIPAFILLICMGLNAIIFLFLFYEDEYRVMGYQAIFSYSKRKIAGRSIHYEKQSRKNFYLNNQVTYVYPEENTVKEGVKLDTIKGDIDVL